MGTYLNFATVKMFNFDGLGLRGVFFYQLFDSGLVKLGAGEALVIQEGCKGILKVFKC